MVNKTVPSMDDIRINAGISLSRNEREKIKLYQKAAGLNSASEVVRLLIDKKLPALWYELELEKGKKGKRRKSI
jgi:hypothetical protein